MSGGQTWLHARWHEPHPARLSPEPLSRHGEGACLTCGEVLVPSNPPPDRLRNDRPRLHDPIPVPASRPGQFASPRFRRVLLLLPADCSDEVLAAAGQCDVCSYDLTELRAYAALGDESAVSAIATWQCSHAASDAASSQATS